MPISFFNGANLSNMLRAITASLNYPVIAILLLLAAAAIVLTGSLIVEFFTDRRTLKVKMPALIDSLRRGDKSPNKCIAESGLLKRQKKVLLELTRHPELTDEMREALSVRLIEETQEHYERIVKVTDTITKLGPIFGLLGTLIPLGPGIIALGQGDTFTLSQSLLTAFDTTVVGLITSAVTMIISIIRKTWYANYMSILEALMDCILEVTKNDEA